jgi:hypothetical protein
MTQAVPSLDPNTAGTALGSLSNGSSSSPAINPQIYDEFLIFLQQSAKNKSVSNNTSFFGAKEYSFTEKSTEITFKFSTKEARQIDFYMASPQTTSSAAMIQCLSAFSTPKMTLCASVISNQEELKRLENFITTMNEAAAKTTPPRSIEWDRRSVCVSHKLRDPDLKTRFDALMQQITPAPAVSAVPTAASSHANVTPPPPPSSAGSLGSTPLPSSQQTTNPTHHP